MSAPLVTFDGYSGLMTMIVRNIVGGINNCMIRLFQNDYYPVQSSVWTDFVEVTMPGYMAMPIPSGTDRGINANNIDVWNFPPVTFGPYTPSKQVVFGYWVDWTNPMTMARQSLWCQRFDAPFAFTLPGQTLPLILTRGLDQGPTWIPEILTKPHKRRILTTDP